MRKISFSHQKADHPDIYQSRSGTDGPARCDTSQILFKHEAQPLRG